jgi:hypothetical protein
MLTITRLSRGASLFFEERSLSILPFQPDQSMPMNLEPCFSDRILSPAAQSTLPSPLVAQVCHVEQKIPFIY